MKTILLCLNQLGAGGVETAALNQTIQLIKRDYRVVILAKDGIYRKKFEEEGAIFIENNFVVSNKYDIEKINIVIEIINKYNVEQVHIHQFDCINTLFPACILTKTPYVAYAHTGITGIYDWFEKCYICYKMLFKLYFNCSEKIIAITEQAKQEIIEKYSIDKEKIMVIKNSIDFESFSVKNITIPKEIKNFLIISRMSKEKVNSIKNSIYIFKEYLKYNNKSKLTIVGDGEYKDEIQKEIEDISLNVQFEGEKNNIAEIIAQNDVVIALDRCILETIAIKRIPIISGYEGIKGIVTPEIIKEASNTNFSGKKFENKNVQEIVQEIIKLDEKEIVRIVEENYKFAYENLNSSKNIYLIENYEKTPIILDEKDAMNTIIELQNMYQNNVEYTDNVYKECKKTEIWLQNKVNNAEKENEELKIEIERLKNQIAKMPKNKMKKFLKKIVNIINTNK